MKRLLLVIFLFVFSTSAYATPFYFSGTAIEKDDTNTERQVGSTSASLNFVESTNKLTVYINNTSNTTFTYTDPTATFTDNNGASYTLNTGQLYDQASGIVGFGFNLIGSPVLTGYSLKAFDKLGNLTSNLIGLDSDNLDWLIDDNSRAGITLDYLPQTDGDIKGALYNPAAIGSSALAALPNYFTTATLILDFDSDPILDLTDDWSPFVRFQNVGAYGLGSTKDTPTPIPEPATMILLGTGLIGLAGASRKKLFKK